MGHNGDLLMNIFMLRCGAQVLFDDVFYFKSAHPDDPVSVWDIFIFTFSGSSRLIVCMHVCVCLCARIRLPGYLAAPPLLLLRITASGRSRASAWQRGRGLRITAGAGRCVCGCLHGCWSTRVCGTPLRKWLIPSSYKANHLCDPPPPQNWPEFDAR